MPVRLARLGSVLLVAAVLGMGTPGVAIAGAVSFGAHDVRSVFHVAKSENRNEVHYGLRLDAACRPTGKQPVFAYWRRPRAGAVLESPLDGPGTTVYGPANDPKVRVTAAGGGSVLTYVKALKRVPIEILIAKTAEGCKATPVVTLKKERVRLSHAFLQLGRFGMMVKHVDVFGFRDRDGGRISERFE